MKSLWAMLAFVDVPEDDRSDGDDDVCQQGGARWLEELKDRVVWNTMEST